MTIATRVGSWNSPTGAVDVVVIQLMVHDVDSYSFSVFALRSQVVM